MRNLFLLTILIAALSGCKKDKEPNSTLNPWDGKYRVDGTLVDVTDATYTQPVNKEYVLITGTATTDTLMPIELGIPGHLVLIGGSLSYYSKFALLLTFDPNTNKITSITNTHGQPSSNGRSVVLDPSGVNAFDPATKNIQIKYWMDEVGVAGHRVSFDETWVYLGPR